tara:strand:- start:2002 stop:3789 length:1788 start_codon:yes stop_codon:yes gene_type:complete
MQMAKYDGMKPGEILADASVAEFISSLGLGIAAAQQALDENTISQLGQFSLPREGLGNRSLLDLGLMPAFYHYQYADISCSMQIRLEVGKSFEIGGQASLDFNSGDNSSSQNSLNQNSEESETSTSSINRTAEMKYNVTETGIMSLNGTNYTATGATPALRLKNLREQLLGNASSNIEGLVFEPPITTPPVLSTLATNDKVLIQSPFVTFLKTTVPYGFIWMKANQDTDYIINDSTTISTSAGTDLATYATSVLASFSGSFTHQDDRVSMFTPQMAQQGDEFNSVSYDTGVSELEGEALERAVLLANLVKYINLPVEIEGFTDRVGGTAKNLELGKSRANRMKDVFIAHGVNANLITIRPSRGEAVAAEAGDNNGTENANYRKTSVYIPTLESYVLKVQSTNTNLDSAEIAPNAIMDINLQNGWFYLAPTEPLSISSEALNIDNGTANISYSGSTVDGFASGHANAYAENLARAVNALPDYAASRTGATVRIMKATDTYSVKLFSKVDQSAELTSNETYQVTKNFNSSTSSTTNSEDNSQSNSTVAVGVSIDARYSRQFEMEVTGNSQISARLVSIPAPPEFLKVIKEYQNGLGE